MTKPTVLDSSALLALLHGEPGADRVFDCLAGAAISTVNIAETVGKLIERGTAAGDAQAALSALPLDVRPFTAEQAQRAGALLPLTQGLGLSLGDRACLALATEMNAIALTADRDWARADLGVEVELIR